MTSTSNPDGFTHVVAGSGPAQGFTVTGKRRPAEKPAAQDVPLVIAVHGGTYTSDYFDIPGYSLLDRAEALGIPIVAVDRPAYGGSTPVEPADSIILKNAEVLDHVIAELWQKWGAGTSGVFLIGHSIGGAVVTAIAAGQPDWPLLGIAVSGCLLQVPAEARDGFNALPDILMIDLPSPMKDGVMFGPEWTYDEVMPEASHPSDTLIPRAELIDINNGWIGRVREVNARVTVPVQCRQGEFDRLWITDAQQMRDFGAAFTGAPRVDARLVASAGHCVDFHRAGAGLQLGQLGFALECAVREKSA
ncbi:MAG TPA: alpha/beta hydrolase [Actinocrinis sp.]|nr:alpha/beta hydrolase [Actinocrinis sp.]